MEALTVEKLILFLLKQKPSMQIAFNIYSGCKLMELEEIKICKMHPARADGWKFIHIQDEDKDSIEYLVFP